MSLYVTRDRLSKYGDYRRAIPGHPARITINEGLNSYEFLLTLVHEMAHHGIAHQRGYVLRRSVFSKMFGKTAPGIRPHGIEWQNNYQLLVAPLLTSSVFPDDLLCLLKDYFKKPKASVKGHQRLVMALKQYDPPDGLAFVEHLPEGATFSLPDGRTFIKKEKLRKRYRCYCLTNKKVYLFSPIAKVQGGNPGEYPKI